MLADVPGLRRLILGHFLPTTGDPTVRAQVVLRRATQHALLVHVQAIATADDWPADLRQALTEARQQQARRALRQAGLLAQVQAACDAAGRRLLALKGVALAALLHRDIGARQSGDLDLLVPPDGLGAMASLLGELGFTPERTWRGVSPARLDAMAQTFHEFVFEHPDGLLVEVHTRLTTAFIPHVPSFDVLWQDRQEVRIAGRQVGTPGWPDVAVHLATHGYRHGWARLGWLCDIAHLMARDDVAWDEAARRARRRHEEVALAGSLQLAHDLLGARMPPTVDVGTRSRRAARAVQTRIEAGHLATAGRIMLADQWRSRDSLGDGVRYLWQVATNMTPADCRPGETWPPPPFTRYVRRPLRLVRRYVVGTRPGAAPSTGR